MIPKIRKAIQRCRMVQKTYEVHIPFGHLFLMTTFTYITISSDHDSEERDRNHLESNLVKESGYSADVESSPSLSSDSGGSDSERHTPTSSYDGIDCKLLCKNCFPTENKMLSKISRRLSDFSSYSKIWESNWQSQMRHWRLMSVVR